jgi:hypothetical protein
VISYRVNNTENTSIGSISVFIIEILLPNSPRIGAFAVLGRLGGMVTNLSKLLLYGLAVVGRADVGRAYGLTILAIDAISIPRPSVVRLLKLSLKNISFVLFGTEEPPVFSFPSLNIVDLIDFATDLQVAVDFTDSAYIGVPESCLKSNANLFANVSFHACVFVTMLASWAYDWTVFVS